MCKRKLTIEQEIQLKEKYERNMMLLYVHVYYSSFGMQRKYNKFVKRFREHNGRD